LRSSQRWLGVGRFGSTDNTLFGVERVPFGNLWMESFPLQVRAGVFFMDGHCVFAVPVRVVFFPERQGL